MTPECRSNAVDDVPQANNNVSFGNLIVEYAMPQTQRHYKELGFEMLIISIFKLLDFKLN